MKPKFISKKDPKGTEWLYGVYRPENIEYGRNGIRRQLCKIDDILIDKSSKKPRTKEEQEKHKNSLFYAMKEKLLDDIRTNPQKYNKNNGFSLTPRKDIQRINQQTKEELEKLKQSLRKKEKLIAAGKNNRRIFPVVYFIRSLSSNQVKIGRSKNYLNRLNAIQTSNAELIVPIGVVRCINIEMCIFLESYLHDKYKARRGPGGSEWFTIERQEIEEDIRLLGGDVF